MIEDKLTHDERLRLECLAQSIAAKAAWLGPNAPTYLELAALFESYVVGKASDNAH